MHVRMHYEHMKVCMHACIHVSTHTSFHYNGLFITKHACTNTCMRAYTLLTLQSLQYEVSDGTLRGTISTFFAFLVGFESFTDRTALTIGTTYTVKPVATLILVRKTTTTKRVCVCVRA